MGWLTGDTLGIFGILAGSFLTAAVGALATPPGWRSNVLWSTTVVFLILLGLFVAFHGQVPAGIATALGSMLLPPLVVVVVALMISGRRAEGISAAVAAPAAGPGRRDRLTLPGETPGLALDRAMRIIALSRWALEHNASDVACMRELRDKLAAHNLTAFGRRTKDAVIEPIPAQMWPRMTLDVDANAAIMSESLEGVFSGLQFDKDMVLRLWPQLKGGHSWMGA
jgi:hypothetical protein